MNNPELEEMAALQAMGLLDPAGQEMLRQAAEQDAEVRRLLEDFNLTASLLAYDVPQITPPASVLHELMREVNPPAKSSKIIAFPQWIPYAVAACLMGLAVYQANRNLLLREQVRSAVAAEDAMRQSNNLEQLRMVAMDAKDPAYGAAKVMVAWNPTMHQGVVSMQNMPVPPADHDYQLWVLDPEAPAPMNAGVLVNAGGMHKFSVQPVSKTIPGFAISLEPSGGRPAPSGEILFAVAPAQ